MPDNGFPPADPGQDGDPPFALGAPASAQPQQDTDSAPRPATGPRGAGTGSAAGLSSASHGDARLDGRRMAAGTRRVAWTLAALLCFAAGTLATLLGTHALARSDAEKTRLASDGDSATILANLERSVQREQDLARSSSTFFAANPEATPAEFHKWAGWARALSDSPELERLGLVTVVQGPELASFEARISGHPLTQPVAQGSALQTSTPQLTPSPGGAPRIVPAGTRPSYCLLVAALARSGANHPPAGLDYCARTRGLMSTRDSGRSIATVGRSGTLTIQTPIYKGGATPLSVGGRRAAFVGWLRQVLSPPALATAAAHGHTAGAVSLHYRAGAASLALLAGSTRHGAQGRRVDLHGGWSATVFAGRPGAGMLSNGTTLALLIAGITLSALIGLLFFLLGARPLGGAAARVTAHPREELYDPLTGLPNRTLTLDLAERMVARAARQSGMLAGALFIDIDWFKDINERLGAPAGDQLLKTVAERLGSVVRTGDTVGRLGGDQFVVLVESPARGVRLDSLARRAIEALHKPVALDDFGPSFSLTVSIGVAFGRYGTSDELVRDAELALRAAKSAGKDRFTLFNANMRSVIEDRGMLEVDLNAALQEHQFFLLYQPIYDLGSGQMAGLEAMIRWRHPSRGVLLPEEFIPLAEESGLIVPIGRWVLEEACCRAAAWNVGGHRVGISVMVSANQLHRDGFATDVRRALQQSGIDPSLLTLELAEASVMLDIGAAAERLQAAKQQGVRVAIDDFGSGYAYRSDLRQLPLDYLKVDRSSLAASDDEDYRSWLLEAILHFGRDLSLTVIAKGIETAEQLSAIQAMGCTMAQGYLTGEPTSVDRVEALFGAPFPPAQAATTQSE
jgi:diguanylate cyclase (GGDEF)-like protein